VAIKGQSKAREKEIDMTYLVTGGCGFVGSNIAAQLIERGQQLVVFDNMSREGATQNLEWLRSLGEFEFVRGDVREHAEVIEVVERTNPSVIFHLAGQVAMTISMQDPQRDFAINVLGTFNLLESVRCACPQATIVYSSSNKVYGDLAGVKLKEEALRYSATNFPNGIDESAPLDFQTPYGCSKGAADQYMLDYARVFDLNTVVFRHSTIFGGRQFATFDQGWVGWFCRQALEVQRNPQRQPFTISGNGKQVRDLLFVDDCVACYFAAANKIKEVRGQAFNIGGGMENSSSLLELFQILKEELDVQLKYTRLPWRHSDQKFFVADNSKAKTMLGWKPRTTKHEGILKTIDWARQTT
jgi:CDP-paratose 2-epimerase